ncbi:MAG: hypothetical protein LH481_04600 [Burkholderiales bacterium]|nr:hypothetical protein [Burkholderiales bacterium]
MSGHSSSPSSPSSSSTPANKNNQEHDPVRDMAVQIYVKLASDAIVVADATAKITASPESLAKISFKLAEAFQKLEAEMKASAAPKHATFDVDKLDFDAWTTK